MSRPRTPTSPGSLERVARRAIVVELVAAGMTDRAIGRELGLSGRAVRSIVAAERRRAGLESRTALASYWLLSPACTPVQRERLRARLHGHGA